MTGGAKAMDWNCTITEERLSDALENALSREEVAAYSAHLAGCSNCRDLARRVGSLVDGMHGLGMVAEPPFLAAKIIHATLGPRRTKQGLDGWLARLAALLQPRFAMGAVTVAASLLIVLQGVGLSPMKMKKMDLSPGNLLRSANRQVHLTYARSVKFVNDLRVVYEIQSRLVPAQEPVSAPAPAPEPRNEPPAASPQQKSEKDPPRDRTQLRNKTMFAVLMPAIAGLPLAPGPTGSSR